MENTNRKRSREGVYSVLRTQSEKGNRERGINADALSLLCGGEGIRTPDPLNAIQVLSQLSYTPGYGVIHPRARGHISVPILFRAET